MVGSDARRRARLSSRTWRVVLLALVGLSEAAHAERLRLGVSTHKPPYVYEHDGRGLELDIIRAAMHEAGLAVELRHAPHKRLQRLLRNGELDAIATIDRQLDLPVSYSQPYVTYRNVAISLAARALPLARIEDLASYSVSAFENASVSLGEPYRLAVRRSPHYREEPDQATRNRLLYLGRIDVIVGDLRIVEHFNAELANEVDVAQPVVVHEFFAPMHYRLGFREAGWRDRFDGGLARLRERGDYARIEARYADPSSGEQRGDCRPCSLLPPLIRAGR